MNLNYKILIVLLAATFTLFSCENGDEAFDDIIRSYEGTTALNYQLTSLETSPVSVKVAEAGTTVSYILEASSNVGNRAYSIEVDPASEAVEGVDFTLTTDGAFEEGSYTDEFSLNFDYASASEEGKTLILNLVSNDAVVITEKLYLNVQALCPNAAALGTYVIVSNGFTGSNLNPSFEMVAGDNPNQFVAVDMFGHGYDIVMEFTPETGLITVATQDAWVHPQWGLETAEGGGTLDTCAGSLTLGLNYFDSAGGWTGNPFDFVAIKF